MLNKFIRRSFSISSATTGCIPWRFDGKQRGNPSHQEEEEDSEDSDNLAAETWYYKGESVAQNNIFLEQPLAHGASSSVDQESQKDTEATWDHCLHITPNTSHYVEAVFSMVRKIYGRQLGDAVKDLNVDVAIWGLFMNTTLRAAVHLGIDCDTNLHYAKNHLWDSLGQLFCEIKRLISEQSEKVHIFSDSVLCVGEMGGDPNAAWKNKLKWYSPNNHLKELNRIDGMQMVFRVVLKFRSTLASFLAVVGHS